MNNLLGTLLGLTALLAAAAAAVLASFLGCGRSVQYNDSDCVLIPNVAPGSEDIAVVDNGLALVSAGDLGRILFKSGKPDRGGEIFAVNFFGDDDVRAEQIPIEGMPDLAREAFHPHGISFSNRTGLLYAISHDCGERFSETIEILRLVREPSLVLRHERTVKIPSVPLGGLNDVVEGTKPGELYVTQWLSHPIHKRCHGNGRMLDELGMTFDALFRRKTKVLRCVWDPERPKNGKEGDDLTCDTVAEGFKGANGIAADPEGNRIFVVDAPDHALSVFDRKDEDGSLSLRDTLDLRPYALDNVEFDVASRKLTLSGNPRLYEVIGKLEGDSEAEVSGGMITVEPKGNGSYVIEDLLVHDGSKLSMISSAVFVNGKILLGSPPSDGVLMCPIPETALASKQVLL